MSSWPQTLAKQIDGPTAGAAQCQQKMGPKMKLTKKEKGTRKNVKLWVKHKCQYHQKARKTPQAQCRHPICPSSLPRSWARVTGLMPV